MSNSETLHQRDVFAEVTGEVAVIGFVSRIFQKYEADDFRMLLNRLRARSIRQYVIDLSGCDYVSSEGLGATAQCWKWCHDEGNGRMAVVLPSQADHEVRNLFDIIGLSRTIGSAIQPTIDDARAYLLAFG
jgi:anti-anti-sigma factor